MDKHRTIPTHWALVWDDKERFFIKTDFSRVMKNSVIALGHYGARCHRASPSRLFTLVDTNGIHATAICFCGCTAPDGQVLPDFQQLLRAGIFPGTVKEPKTGYTLGVLEYYRELRNQDKGSAYDFVRVLQRMADPHFASSVPVSLSITWLGRELMNFQDIYINFLAISRFHQFLDILLRRGYAHGLDDPLPGESDRPYPNRQPGYLGLICAACPERGVNMPLSLQLPSWLRYVLSQAFNRTLPDSSRLLGISSPCS
jgi:hypothetical protein